MSRRRATSRPTQPLARGSRPIATDVGDAAEDITAEIAAPSEPRHDRLTIPAIDAGAVASMARGDLEVFVNFCRHLRGEAPLCTFEGITDDELRELALRAWAGLTPAR